MGVGTSHGHFGPWDTPRPGPREYATTILPIVYSATLRRTYIQVAQIPGTPEMESRNCLEIVATGLPELWTAITLDCRLGSRRGLSRSCSPRRDLSNAMWHAQIGCREGIDSRLLMVGSQIASLTPGPSFAHNLGCRCPNCQCEGIFDIYVSRPFQRHQEHPNARCFSPCCRALNIRESRRTPNPRFFQVLGFTPTLGQSRVATENVTTYSFQCLVNGYNEPHVQNIWKGSDFTTYLWNCRESPTIVSWRQHDNVCIHNIMRVGRC